MRNLALAFILVLSLSSCTQSKTDLLKSSKQLLLRLEERKISEDIITEYRLFDSALVNKTVIYSSEHLDSEGDSKGFETSFEQVKISKLKVLSQQIQELRELEHRNYFPWKKDFYERGDVIKFEIQGDNGLAKTFYYYTGDTKAPDIFGLIYKQFKN